MKNYQEIMEVMSMKDMKQITGGTDAQRKIAQDRQRAREAKNRGFDPKKEVVKDKPKQQSDKVPDGLDDLLKDIRNEPKKPEPTKGGALVKRKPDIRKSQIGKWSQGVKSNPNSVKKSGEIVKSKETKPASPEVEKVNVKVDKKNDMEGQAASRPLSTKSQNQKPKKEVGKGVVDRMKNKKKEGPGVISRVKDAINKTNTSGSVGVSSSGDLEGLSGRNKGLIG